MLHEHPLTLPSPPVEEREKLRRFREAERSQRIRRVAAG